MPLKNAYKDTHIHTDLFEGEGEWEHQNKHRVSSQRTHNYFEV